jgi:hypothetical protein
MESHGVTSCGTKIEKTHRRKVAFMSQEVTSEASPFRASTLVHISSPIGRLMQCHIGFLMMWRRESTERERGRCLAKQPPHEQNNYLMREIFAILTTKATGFSKMTTIHWVSLK